MTNPFMNLGIQRIGFPVEFTEPPQTWLPSHPWTEAAEPFDDLVFRVLQDLIDAAYPNHSIRSHRTKNKHRYYSELDEQPAWSIGYFHEQLFSETGRYKPEIVWVDAVTVTLISDETNKAASFECGRSGGYIVLVEEGEDQPWQYDSRPWEYHILKVEGWPRRALVLYPKIRCELTEAGLVEAIKQLHPPEASLEAQERVEAIVDKYRQKRLQQMD